MSDGKLAGVFTPVEKAAKAFKEEFKLEETIYKAGLPDFVAKFTVDLATERNEKKLSDASGGEELFKEAHWFYCKILVKGTGNYEMEFVLKDKSTVSLSQDEITKGDEIYLEFTELKFTNSEQGDVTNPVLWLERRELS